MTLNITDTAPPPHIMRRNRADTAWVADCPHSGAMMHLGHHQWRCPCGDWREVFNTAIGMPELGLIPRSARRRR